MISTYEHKIKCITVRSQESVPDIQHLETVFEDVKINVVNTFLLFTPQIFKRFSCIQIVISFKRSY